MENISLLMNQVKEDFRNQYTSWTENMEMEEYTRRIQDWVSNK
jgi:hypothetical protein